MLTLPWWIQERQAGKQENQSRNQFLSLTMRKVWWGLMGRMEQHLASYTLTCCSLKVCKIFVSLFDMTLFNVYFLSKHSTLQKLNYNWFRLVVAEKLLDGLIILEYARQGRPDAAAPVRLQVSHWAHFL